MSRTPIAIIAGLVGFVLYLSAVTILADGVVRLHWAIQAVYYVLAGSLWVLPIRWLMFWAAGRR